VPWDDRIPYPVFAIAAHIFIWDCPLEAGPTGVIPGSHTSGRPPPGARIEDDDLEWNGRPVRPIVAAAGDVALFVSDVWHRGMPAKGGTGRLFLQVHYGRRDIAQRLRSPELTHQLSPEALARATTPRERTLVGIHEPFFYDA
jgi:ectoine hydroxylase-related dioxygenase (phytanoyl-CoA dioxygenase family)